MGSATFHLKTVLIVLVLTVLPAALLAQGIEGPALQGPGAQTNGEGRSSGSNEYGWPTDYEAQVGAGVTNGVTTGTSGPEETAGGDQQISFPPLPSADLCEPWKGTEAHAFCLEKVVQ